ncbi:Cytoplasmic tRNA 2-thiolation protein 2 [Echinococcus granulosus]|uniref:Cytoplasmic tRNA 2-thiolation protein 2 n=1 Tax=Echinococcus granulosus TaxID=6210 RepID=W6U7T4_ECHGR|nr:Cytoplasmic tRNA 2-thiolation protein 2 [Echinococcus granulosus]EUB57283.1 Cytoplasmic tRNA 2-thiolation protein 2 [Echinococcus granulosus]
MQTIHSPAYLNSGVLGLPLARRVSVQNPYVEQPYPVRQEEAMKAAGFEYRIIPFTETNCSYVVSTRITNSTLTAAEEMLRWQRLQYLLIYTSRVLGYKYLLVGDNASQLAARCLAGIAQGRGGTVATELDFADTRYSEVTILRPMYNFLAKEVALFLHFAGLDTVVEMGLSAQQNVAYGPGVSSIQRLTQDFIGSLQFAGYPSTTMAVLNAASRTLSSENRSDQRCTVCYAPLPRSNQENSLEETVTALSAYEFSARISRNSKTSCNPASPPPFPPPNSPALCSCCLFNRTELQKAVHVPNIIMQGFSSCISSLDENFPLHITQSFSWQHRPTQNWRPRPYRNTVFSRVLFGQMNHKKTRFSPQCELELFPHLSWTNSYPAQVAPALGIGRNQNCRLIGWLLIKRFAIPRKSTEREKKKP